jgi:predicted nucleotidyltransferase component of viral defense system
VPESFLSLRDEERKEILQTLGPKLGLAPAVLEKDVWVCWALQHLFAMPGAVPMAFKGGTSLSKVFNAIKRFSEDIDVTFDYRVLVTNANPFEDGISRSQITKIDTASRNAVKEYTHNRVLPYFKSLIVDQFGESLY